MTALMLACGGSARAGLLFTYTDSSCNPSCGSGPYGTVTVAQDMSGNQEIDFTVQLNSPYEFHSSTASPHPLFAVNFSSTTSVVTFGNFQLNGASTSFVQQGTGSGNVPDYGAFGYTVVSTTTAPNFFSGKLTFTASVSGMGNTISPGSIVPSTGSQPAYMTADIISSTLLGGNGNTGNVAAINVPTPEPAGLGLFAVALAGLGVVRSRRPRR